MSPKTYRIAIDCRAYGWAGIGRYTRSLLKALLALESRHTFIALVGEKDAASLRRDLDAWIASGQLQVKTVEDSYYSWREQTLFWYQVENLQADLIHFTHFNVPVFLQKRYVVTIHDVTRFFFPGQTQQGLLKQAVYEWVFQRAVERATRVIVVSETTRQALHDLQLFLRRDPSVIFEGVEEEFFEPISATQRAKVHMLAGTQKQYILYVGVWMNHKNLPRLLRAFASVRRRFPDLKLVMTGKPKPTYVNMLKLARAAGVADHVLFLGFVPEELLPALYAEAACVCLPSLYEGFGLPALEAAAAEAPVVTSNLGASAEIMKGSALLVNPEYEPGLVRALEQILGEKKLRRELIEKGKQRARQFDWGRCARETLAVYEEALQLN